MYPTRLAEILEDEHRRITAIKHEIQGDPSYVPIFLTGGVGDGVLCLSTIHRLKAEGYRLLIYSHHAEALRYFYKDIPLIKGDFPTFTWCIHLDSVVKFKFSPQFSGFLLPEHKRLFEQQLTLFRQRPDIEYLVTNHPRFKSVLAQKAVEMGFGAKELPIFCLGFSEPEAIPPLERKPIERYITIHDGYDNNNYSSVSSRCTKQWKWEHWNRLIYLFSAKYPSIEIIQIGSKTSRQIDGVTTQMVNKTTFTEAFDLISKAIVHVDTDSGLVHAATHMGVPAVAIFGPSPKDFYGHKENTNLFSTKSCVGGCFHLGNNWQVGWMDRCPIGYSTPRCMDDVEPEEVLKAIEIRVKEQL